MKTNSKSEILNPKRVLVIGILIPLLSGIVFSNRLFEKIEIRERFDYLKGLVILERYSDTLYLGIEKVLTFDEYLEYRTRISLAKEFAQKKEQERKREEYLFDTEGLIPEIAIPKLPIFGEGSKINISGSDRITFGGRQTFVSGGPTGMQRPSFLPQLKMEQQLRLNLDGTIGDRTKVLIDHDSEREFEGKNKIRLSYTGNEDEILQTLEAGDTRLGIPGTAYTGDLPAFKGLFGISATGKVGGLTLYGVASREQSQAETKEFRGRTAVKSETIPDFEFEARRFFIVDTQDTQIKNLRVYVDDVNPYNNANQNTIRCLATIYPDRPGDTVEYSHDRYKGDFSLLRLGTDYLIGRDGNYIELVQSLGHYHVLGVSYTIGDDSVGGTKFEDSLLVLKLIKPYDSRPRSKTWNYELRNIYKLRATEVKLETLIIYRKTDDDPIYRETETEGPKKDVPFTKILGLDPDGDGTIVYPQFDSRRGIIIFPYRFPFGHPDLSVKDTLFYWQPILPPDFRAKYYIYVKYSSAYERFLLGQTDIEQNSEKVFVNNELWTRDVDYKLNYETGELDFIRRLPPNADIRVTFEYRPFFSLAQKSLIGLRGESKFLENGRFGSSVFYRSEGVPEYKPSLGAEPFRRMIGELDFSYALKSEGLTNILDALPLLSASSPSSFSASGEAAVSLPDPNTRGVAYLDDFEGSLITRELYNKNNQWSWAGVPFGKDTGDFAKTPLFWFNRKKPIRKDSIFSGLGAEGGETQELLTIVFTPDDTSSWAGITQPAQYGMNLLEAENLEVVFRIRSKNNRKARLHFSVGSSIDEDAPRRNKKAEIVGFNGRLDTEDKNQNGTLDIGEDTGLDGVFGKDEENISGDDGNDDFVDPLKTPNSTEGNRLLNTEDLDLNGFSTSNDYFEYSVSLESLQYFQELLNQWRFLRIPLLDSLRYKRIGNPRWEDIRSVRLWFDGFRTTDTIDIYSISFVGSKWRNVRVLTLDSLKPVDSLEKGFVGQISKKTDPNYESPYTPRRDPYTGKFEFEAALQLKFYDLNPDHYILVSKRTYDREDWREYSALKIYLHKDERTNPDFILRFGGDSLNYYEYRERIDAGSAIPGKPGWFEFTIDLESFPVLKTRPASGRPNSKFALQGNPSLSEIRYYGLGVVNTSSGRITGSVWVNDIRLVSPRREPGYASQGRLSVNLSDFASFGFGISLSDPNFRRFSEPRGVKTGGFAVNQGYDARLNLDRLLPQKWNFSIPLTYRRSVQTGRPKYSTLYPDLRITQGRESKEQSKSFQEGWALTNVQKRKSANKILNWTIEALSYSFQTSRSFSAQPLSIDTFRQVSNNLNYAITPNMKFTIFGTDFSYFPNNIQIGLGVQKSKAPRWNIIKRDTLPDTIIQARSDSSHSGSFDLNIGYAPFENLTFDYGIATDRDLYVLTPDYLFGSKIGTEAGRDENFDAGYSLEIGEILSPRIDFSGDYREDRFKTGLDYAETRNVFNSGDIDLGVDIELPEILEGLGKSDRAAKDSLLLPGSPKWIIANIGKLAENLEPLELSFSRSRSTDLLNILERPPLLFRLGLVDIDTPKIKIRPGERLLATRDYRDDFSGSSGAQVKDLKANFRFDHSISRTVQGQSTQASWSTTFPDLTLSLSQVEQYLKKWATSSSISSGLRRRSELSGTIVDNKLDSTTQNRSGSWEFSPLIGWQTTWKRRFTTNLTTNYSKAKSVTFFSRDTTENWSSGFNLSVSYAFSAPQGFKIPGLPKIRFSQELSLSANFGFSSTKAVTRGPNRPFGGLLTRDDANFTSQLSGSYRVSRSIESGVQTGFNTYLNRQNQRTTRTVSLDFWLLFRF